jgi:hypothetical protein
LPATAEKVCQALGLPVERQEDPLKAEPVTVNGVGIVQQTLFGGQL